MFDGAGILDFLIVHFSFIVFPRSLGLSILLLCIFLWFYCTRCCAFTVSVSMLLLYIFLCFTVYMSMLLLYEFLCFNPGMSMRLLCVKLIWYLFDEPDSHFDLCLFLMFILNLFLCFYCMYFLCLFVFFLPGYCFTAHVYTCICIPLLYIILAAFVYKYTSMLLINVYLHSPSLLLKLTLFLAETIKCMCVAKLV
jgi:hypothetical protein